MIGQPQNMRHKFIHLLLFTLASSFAFAQPFTIGNTTITFNDPNRTGGFGSGGGPGRQIQTEIYYPANTQGTNVAIANGQFPVIVFGHGFVMTWDVYNNIWEHFVPQGYVMAFPRTEGSIGPSHENFGLDLRQVAEKMQDENNNSNSIFYQALLNETAIMGHSMGGGSTVLAGASNVNISTIVGMAPAETNPSAVAAAGNVTVPALVFSGSSDGVTPPQDHHLPIYNALGSSCKVYISIIDGSHCYFANNSTTCSFGEFNPGSLPRLEQQDIVSDFLSLWLDYTLRNNSNAFTTFNDSLDASSRITFQKNCSITSIDDDFPKPFEYFTGNDFIRVKGANQIDLFDLSGRMVLSEAIPSRKSVKNISIGHLKAGVYIVHSTAGDRIFTDKIIVQ